MNSRNYSQKAFNIFGLILMLLLSSCTEHRVKSRFFTQGGCEECKLLIEEALEKMSGVDSVAWSYQTSLTTVIFDTTRTNEEDLQKALAKKGFETAYFPADTEAQKNLPPCCTKNINRSLIPPGIHGHGQGH